jgi:hypothetical protein
VLSMLVGAILHRVLLERAKPNEKWLNELVEATMLGVIPR